MAGARLLRNVNKELLEQAPTMCIDNVCPLAEIAESNDHLNLSYTFMMTRLL